MLSLARQQGKGKVCFQLMNEYYQQEKSRGIGIKHLKHQSKVLKVKWLLRHAQDSEYLCSSVIKTKYGQLDKQDPREVTTITELVSRQLLDPIDPTGIFQIIRLDIKAFNGNKSPTGQTGGWILLAQRFYSQVLLSWPNNRTYKWLRRGCINVGI